MQLRPTMAGCLGARASAWLRFQGGHLFGSGLSFVKTAARPRWRVSQTIRNRAEPHVCRRRKDGMPRTKKSTWLGRGKGKPPAKLKPQDGTLGLTVVHPKAVGIDVGKGEPWVAVLPRWTRNRYDGSDALPRIWWPWPTGWSALGLKRRRGNRRECTGSRCTTFWQNEASGCLW